jgi:alcohol dehydrogenase
MSCAFGWHMPVQVSFGAGCADTLAEALGPRSVLVMAVEPAEALGLRARWQAQLGARLLDWVAVPEGLSTLTLARALAQRVWPRLQTQPGTVLLGVGGGSTLDLAKLLRCRPRGVGAPAAPGAGGGVRSDAGINAAFNAVAAAVRGQAGWPALALAPLWLVPTTAGTGSEVTRWATVWDTEAGVAVKRSFDEPFGFAERAFVDPRLTLSCPAALTRDTALDTLAHALEALWNRHATPPSNALAVAAARRVLRHLPEVLQQPQALAGREALSLAALEAGLAFSQTRTALAHALSYALTLEQGVPHGLACALWLPTACQLAVGRSAELDAQLQAVFDVPASQATAALRSWLQALDVPADPAAVGVHDAEARVQQALASARGRNFIAAAL